VTKFVASRSDGKLAWQNSKWLGADVVAALKRLKGEDGPDLLVQGSSDFVQTLWANDLVDEFRVIIFPLALGHGKRLFRDVAFGLKLISAQTYPTGVIVANHLPDGRVQTGDFQFAEPSEPELERRRNIT
jgi:dihydrofolate reductase